MKKSLNLDREIEYLRQYNVEKAWASSLKYSKLLLKKIDKYDITYYYDIHTQYIIELKSNKISLLKSNKYIRIWDNFLNTLKKNYFKDSDKSYTNIVNSIYILHYTSFINN